MTNLIRKMIITIAVMGIIEGCLLNHFYGVTAFLGVSFGTAGAIVNLLSLWQDLKKCVAKHRSMSVPGFIARYTLSGAVLAFAALMSFGALLGAFFGLMNLKFAAFLSWRWQG
ncbi:MAG: hypothetical protein J7J68_01035 [Thermotogaceae bacterium]|nr:hypothetical protein [Thermotogaceae bacterium]